jgi:hypothetical protein
MKILLLLLFFQILICNLIFPQSASAQIDSLGFNYKSTKDSLPNIFTMDLKNGDFFGVSTGYVFNIKSKTFSGSLDVNLNFPYINNMLYLNLGISAYTLKEGTMSAHFNPGLGLFLKEKKIFLFAGGGYFLNTMYMGYNIMLRLNYRISKNYFIGLDNKMIFYGAYESNPDKSGSAFMLGLTLSYRYNYILR